jgi:hypothetical protein
MTRLAGPALVAVLSEARQKFGPTTPENKADVLAWVRQRAREVVGGADVRPFVPRDFDAKAKAAGP